MDTKRGLVRMVCKFFNKKQDWEQIQIRGQ